MSDTMRVLIAEDSTDFAKECQKEMKSLGFDVVLTKKDGRAVIEKLGSIKIDALIMDVFMSGLDGIEVLDYINDSLNEKPLTMILSGVDS